jgi:hypothetical protein
MPMKCVAQMPQPVDTAATSNQRGRMRCGAFAECCSRLMAE